MLERLNVCNLNLLKSVSIYSHIFIHWQYFKKHFYSWTSQNHSNYINVHSMQTFFMENNRKAWWVEFTNTLGFVYLDYKNCCFCAVWMIKLSFILPTITYLHKQHVPFVITSPVYSKWLLLHKSTPHWLQVYVITMLKQHTQTLHKL